MGIYLNFERIILLPSVLDWKRCRSWVDVLTFPWNQLASSQFHWEVRVNHSSRSSSTLLLNINIIKTLSKSSSKTPHVVKAFLFYPVFITVVCEIFALIIYGSPPCMSCKAQSTWRKTLQVLPLSLETSMFWDGDKLQLQAKFGVRKDPVNMVDVLA